MEGFTQQIHLTLDGDTRTISRELALEFPVLRAILETNTAGSHFFLDRSAVLFDDVWMYLSLGERPEENSGLWELEHYGVILDEEDEEHTERVEAQSQCLLDQIMSGIPYHVSAGGKHFMTTKERLKMIGFFQGVFNEAFHPRYSGTAEDPYHLDIPPKVFENILCHLREPRTSLTPLARKMLEPLSGLVTDKTVTKTDGDHREQLDLHQIRSAADTSASHNGSGALMDLVAVGAENVYLTGNSQVSFFKSTYQRHTNFSFDRLTFTFIGEHARRIYTVPRSGDIISRGYLEWKFRDKRSGLAVSGASLLKNQRLLAFKLLESIELEIGGNVLQRIEGFQLYQQSTLDPYYLQSSLEGSMLLDLPFFMFRDLGHSLPVIALQYHEVRFNLNIAEQFIPTGLELEAQLHLTYVKIFDFNDFVSNAFIGTVSWIQTSEGVLHKKVTNI